MVKEREDNRHLKPDEFEKGIIKRLKKKEKIVVKKEKTSASSYVNLANRLFSKTSENLLEKGYFTNLEKELVRGGFQFTSKSYLSVILFTAVLSAAASFLLFLFFLFFNLSALMPFVIPIEESLLARLPKVIWMIVIIPLISFLFVYKYPVLEGKSKERAINQELPFATIHMSAIAGSMIEPSKVFQIIVKTGEYPHLGREFSKIITEINVFGYDLITALRSCASNTPSKKLAELLNGIATTIQSGGDFPSFFNKRAESLLFDYKIEREKKTRSAETFMDIYISVVIAAPMIFMLLLMMMKISGLGLSLSAGMISLIMILGVALINVIFLVFLHMKQPAE